MGKMFKWMVPILLLSGTSLVGFSSVPASAGTSGGFNQYGYNWTANTFVGTYAQWCASENIAAVSCSAYTFGSVNDLLIMKWNAAWNNCNNGLGSATACAGAWVDNESNGMVPGGSGYVWHYKIVWSSSCALTDTPPPGGYCVWGDYATLMDQGTYAGIHTFNALTTPNGYGVYK
jgi:hypothetical protein